MTLSPLADISLPPGALLIGDTRLSDTSAGTATHYFAATGEADPPIPMAGGPEIDLAVAAARTGFLAWSSLTPDRRPGCAAAGGRSVARARRRARRAVGPGQLVPLVRSPPRPRTGRGRVPVLRRLGRQDRRRGGANLVRPGLRLRGRRAVRRHCFLRDLEHPGLQHRALDRSRARGRQRRHHQAIRTRSVRLPPVRRDLPGGGACRRARSTWCPGARRPVRP